MKKTGKIGLLAIAAVFLFAVTLSSCGEVDIDADTNFKFYYQKPDMYELKAVEAKIDDLSMDEATLISTIWTNLKNVPDGADYVSPAINSLQLLNYSLEENALILNFSSNYNTLSEANEILLRAALVKTYSQLNNVSSVEIRVESQPLKKKDDTVIGPQKASDFVNIIGSGLNEYTNQEVTLYFANETGDKLVEQKTNVTYNNSYSLEQVVVSLLIDGPAENSGLTGLIPNGTKLISTSTQKGICYVNFSDALLGESQLAKSDIVIYSIVNTLTEINNISQVQISVSGSSTPELDGTVPLDIPLQRDLNYVDTDWTKPETESETTFLETTEE